MFWGVRRWGCGGWRRRHTGGIQNAACEGFVRLRTHEFLSRRGKEPKAAGGPARFPCGASAPGPPSDKYLVSVEPRRGAPDGVPFGSALTAPLKTFRFQRGPVLREGKSWRGGRASHVVFLYRVHTKKPPLKGEVPAKRAEGFRPPRRKVAAALSAAVTTTKFIGDAPTSQAEPAMQKCATQTPTALRERGSGGEALLSEKRPLPQSLPHAVFLL